MQDAVASFAKGRPIIVMDDMSRENEGDLMIAGSLITNKQMAFMVRYTTGIVCAAMTAERAHELELQPMETKNTDPHQTLFTVSVDSIYTTTGVSAADRCATIHMLSDVDALPKHLRRPGHIFPLISRGIEYRQGHTEAGVALCQLANVPPVAVLSELVRDDGSMCRLRDCRLIAKKNGFPICSVQDIASYFMSKGCVSRPIRPILEFNEVLKLYLTNTVTHVQVYNCLGVQHLVIQYGNQNHEVPAVRIHSECLTGDILGSTHCDCGLQLHRFLSANYERGILIYMRQHEGRGIGLKNKLEAYSLQQNVGLNTVEANQCLGFAADERHYQDALHILESMNVTKIELHTNNPDKIRELEPLIVNTVRIWEPYSHNADKYIKTKIEQCGHLVN